MKEDQQASMMNFLKSDPSFGQYDCAPIKKLNKLSRDFTSRPFLCDKSRQVSKDSLVELNESFMFICIEEGSARSPIVERECRVPNSFLSNITYLSIMLIRCLEIS
jgi:hypothetical protein